MSTTNRLLFVFVLLNMILMSGCTSGSMSVDKSDYDRTMEQISTFQSAAVELSEGVKALEYEAISLSDYFDGSWTEGAGGGAVLRDEDVNLSRMVVVPEDVYDDLMQKAVRFNEVETQTEDLLEYQPLD